MILWQQLHPSTNLLLQQFQYNMVCLQQQQREQLFNLQQQKRSFVQVYPSQHNQPLQLILPSDNKTEEIKKDDIVSVDNQPTLRIDKNSDKSPKFLQVLQAAIEESPKHTEEKQVQTYPVSPLDSDVLDFAENVYLDSQLNDQKHDSVNTLLDNVIDQLIASVKSSKAQVHSKFHPHIDKIRTLLKNFTENDPENASPENLLLFVLANLSKTHFNFQQKTKHVISNLYQHYALDSKNVESEAGNKRQRLE